MSSSNSTKSLILSIETSTRGCSVAIHENGKLLIISELFHDKSSSGMLTTLIEHCVKTINLPYAALSAIAVAKGPGSYTGLRIGVSTAKGLCYTLEKPFIAVNTLQAMAWQVEPIRNENDFLLCPMLDARRMEVYCAMYEASTKQEITPTEAKIIDENSFAELLEKYKIIFFGEGAEKCKKVFANKQNALFMPQEIFPSAKTVGKIAFEKYKSQTFEEVDTFEPYYLKEFMATTPKKQL